ncbi:FG-GAP-like repeat-containing protein [Nannocystis punicea]|uniref:FG-GAP-like repeat-containing protein n=1 Tax=Nannocystis punicea TaxID=2995304 RepID=A0ABY7GVL4_9BACT|nr:FG-GAP-like repeat-containing protein [Nannocystis poenicansa]WAS90977.1 FG-GAP-like repeat-containing protein [Nannocystis poenicansa]
MRFLSLPTSTPRGLDRAWLAGLGLLACGPTPPATTEGPEDTTGGLPDSTTVDPTGPTGSSGPSDTTGPTDTTDPTDTTGPAPECESSADCPYCFDCELGVCSPDPLCCNYLTPDGVDRWRCTPPEHACFGDEDCPDGYICDLTGDCVLEGPLPKILPICELRPTMASEWNLTATPGAFDLADLDGDGDLDLFAAVPSGAAIELAFNDGGGQFTPGTLVDVGPPQIAMHPAAADLDGDGDVDLAVTAPDSGELVLLFGEDGNFTPGPVLTGSSAPWTVTAADVDLDGKVDLMTIGTFLGVSVWFGDGLGGFGPEKFVPDLVDSIDATVADADLDGVPDILTPTSTQENLRLLRGEAGGSWDLLREFEVGLTQWSSALVADLDGFAGPELAIVRGDANSGGLALVWAKADPNTWQDVPQAYGTASLLLGGRFADVTADGVVDLVSATGSATVATLVGDGLGGFSCELVLAAGADTSSRLLAAGDVDGDGRNDIVTGVADGTKVTVLSM